MGPKNHRACEGHNSDNGGMRNPLPDLTRRLFNFIDDSPSPFHAATGAEQLLVDAGFSPLSETESWSGLQGGHVIRRGGALVAFYLNDIDPAAAAFRLIGAHTDSPNLRIKPRPDTGKAGYQQLGVEIYGGVLLNSWLDRDLGLSGRVVVATENGPQTSLVRIDEPQLRVAQLAIHLDRNVNDGLVLDRQTQVTPIWGQGEVDTGGFARLLAESLEVDEGELLGWDVMAHDLTPSAQLGRNGEFYAAPRIDNLASCHAALEALTSTRESSVGATIPVIVLFDHEEIGSDSSTGAGSPLLGNVLERLMMSIGGDRDQYLQAIARSWCVSADGAHAAHPNYLDRHDPDHHVHLNAGPAVKMNANVRYASDAETVAFFRSICASAEVPMQEYVHRTNLACGSTIGPLTAANLGIRVVDVGSAQLSMHSAREMGGIHDPGHLTRAMTAFLSGVS